jgi:hypothetical protein
MGWIMFDLTRLDSHLFIWSQLISRLKHYILLKLLLQCWQHCETVNLAARVKLES